MLKVSCALTGPGGTAEMETTEGASSKVKER
jgi:hypothetical protein